MGLTNNTAFYWTITLNTCTSGNFTVPNILEGSDFHGPYTYCRLHCVVTSYPDDVVPEVTSVYGHINARKVLYKIKILTSRSA